MFKKKDIERKMNNDKEGVSKNIDKKNKNNDRERKRNIKTIFFINNMNEKSE